MNYHNALHDIFIEPPLLLHLVTKFPFGGGEISPLPYNRSKYGVDIKTID